MPSDKVADLAAKIEKMTIPELLRMSASLFDAQPEMALTLADRAVLRMQSKKLFGRDLMERAR
jgi:hypothetical protein